MRDRQGTGQSSGPCMLQYLEVRKWRISTSGQHDGGLKKKKENPEREMTQSHKKKVFHERRPFTPSNTVNMSGKMRTKMRTKS